MTVDKSRQHNVAACIDYLCVRCKRRQLSGRTNPIDDPVADHDSAVTNNREVAHGRARFGTLHRARYAHELCGIADDLKQAFLAAVRICPRFLKSAATIRE